MNDAFLQLKNNLDEAMAIQTALVLFEWDDATPVSYTHLVGLDTLAAALGEDSGTLEDVYEPYLLMKGLINRTPRGRMATGHAYRHLGIAKEGE